MANNSTKNKIKYFNKSDQVQQAGIKQKRNHTQKHLSNSNIRNESVS